MNTRGYILIELLTAILLLALAGAACGSGIIQSLKIYKKILSSDAQTQPFHITKAQLEHDLRNAISLRDYPFHGTQNEMDFPILRFRLDREGKEIPEIYVVRYEKLNRDLVRTEQRLTTHLKREEERKKQLLRNTKTIEFSYAYVDAEKKMLFESFWMDKPYKGLPRGVKVKLSGAEKEVFSGLISLPQGRWGIVKLEDAV